MPVPIMYRKSGEGAIASYAYTDIAEGTGVVLFYGFNSHDDGTDDYHLGINAVRSNDKITINTAAGAANAKRLDIDFDVTFNRPQNIKGNAIGTISWIAGDSNTANYGGTSYAVMKIRKWDGTTETEIASNTKSETFTVPNLEANGTVKLVRANIASVNHFKKGETLRVTIELWSTGGSSGTTIGLCHDPADRAVTTAEYGVSGIDLAPETTQLKIYVPFVLDL